MASPRLVRDGTSVLAGCRCLDGKGDWLMNCCASRFVRKWLGRSVYFVRMSLPAAVTCRR